jgi:glycine betaine/proline transport system ATP-binding protein
MQDELINLQARLHKTIVFITHDLDEALHLGDRIAILKDGRVVQVGTPEEILTNPSDDYVADFTRDVNRVRALTANTVMITPRAMMKPRGGPRLAMKFMKEQGVASVFVVDNENRLVGMMTAETALSAIENGITEITEDLLYEDLDITPKDTYLEELLPLAARNKWPIAVLDDDRRLVGIIPRVSILSALADRPAVNGGISYTTGENSEKSVPAPVAA